VVKGGSSPTNPLKNPLKKIINPIIVIIANAFLLVKGINKFLKVISRS
jgi:hypothetical protein